jgi:predicted Zn-dependent protease
LSGGQFGRYAQRPHPVRRQFSRFSEDAMLTPNRLVRSMLVFGAALALACASASAAPPPPPKAKEKNEFPNATRKEPKTDMSQAAQKKLSEAYAEIDKNQPDKAEALLNEVLSNAKATNYEKAAAYAGLAGIAWERDKPEDAIQFNQKAIALDALDNRGHFGALYQVAQLQLQEEHYNESLAAIDQWLNLTRAEKPDAYAIRGNAMYRLERYPEAAEAMKKAIALSPKPSDSWIQILMASYTDAENYTEAAKMGEEMLAKDPNNKKIMLQLASIYMQNKSGDKGAQKQSDEKALAVLEGAYKRGLLTEERELKQLYQSYNYLDQPEKAAEVINAGLTKGVLKQNADTFKGLADAYELSAEAAQKSKDETRRKELSGKAADAYGKAAALTPDSGDLDMTQGQLLLDLDRFAEAKTALNTALKKGHLKREGECWIVLANAELELGNEQGAVAAYQKARTFPSTQKTADAWLKSMSQGAHPKRAAKKS